jgi:demethylmenaquinone methyltransferase/2-methoxy-6-polyprenyl-1,4-benzoquinol methylase
MFSALAPRYDLANDLISFGLHRLARRCLMQLTLDALPADARVLDLACGSGDLALRLARADSSLRITGADLSPEMLAIAIRKQQQLALHNIDFVEADALALPFDDASFDAAVMGFGIRNVDEPRAGLLELARVLKPGGFLGILEAGAPRKPALRFAYRVGGAILLPLLGGLATGRPSDYAYLHRTSLSFPSGREFAELVDSVQTYGPVRLDGPYCMALWIYTTQKSSR